MALFLSTVKKSSLRGLEDKFMSLTLSVTNIQVRERHWGHINEKPRLRNPTWFTKKTRVLHEDFVTSENKEFLKEVVQDKLKAQNSTPLIQPQDSIIEWQPGLQRPGLIARKIGIYPLWKKNGQKISTTLLQVLDNHVIKYYTPDEYNPPRERPYPIVSKRGCLLIGAEATDPSLLTKEYCNLFKGTGVVPKKYLSRFFVSPQAALSPGTQLTALHFQVGNYVDVRGNTIDRGFQGVMKRHGFKGMPASHGVTKTHRRPGNIGGGGEKGRVWPGTKLPGHMGNRYRILKGLKILRINTKYNVLFVTGQAIAGETNSIVTIYDTILPLRKPTKPLPFPTYLNIDEPVPEDIYSDEIHVFSDPTIEFSET